MVILSENRHCRDIDVALKLISVIKNKASVYNYSLAEIIADISMNKEFEVIHFDDLFLKNLSNAENIPTLWENVISESDIHLAHYEKDVLINFGKNLCACSKQDILSLYDKSFEDLTTFKRTAIENKNSKTKSTAAITISIGIIVVLMLI